MEVSRVQVTEIPATQSEPARVSLVLIVLGATHCFELDAATAEVLGQMLLARAEKIGVALPCDESATHAVGA